MGKKKTFSNLLFVTAAILLFSCSNPYSSSNEEGVIISDKTASYGFSKTVLETFNELGIGAAYMFSINEQDSILTLDIEYIEGYYSSGSANEAIFSLLLYNLAGDGVLPGVKIFEINYRFRNFNDEYQTFTFYRGDYTREIFRIRNNPLYIKAATYAFQQLNDYDEIRFGLMLKKTRETVPHVFKCEGDLWDLLYDYTLRSCDKESQSVKDMDVVLVAASFEKNPTRPEVIEQIIKMSTEDCP